MTVDDKFTIMRRLAHDHVATHDTSELKSAFLSREAIIEGQSECRKYRLTKALQAALSMKVEGTGKLL